MKSVRLNLCVCLGENIEVIKLPFIDKTWISRQNFCFSIQSNIVINEYFNASVGGAGVPQQWPGDVLGGLLRLPPGWSNTCSYWSSTVSKGKTFFNWVTSLLSPLLCRILIFNVIVDDFHFFVFIGRRYQSGGVPAGQLWCRSRSDQWDLSEGLTQDTRWRDHAVQRSGNPL